MRGKVARDAVVERAVGAREFANGGACEEGEIGTHTHTTERVRKDIKSHIKTQHIRHN